jgi:hypothetical protein
VYNKIAFRAASIWYGIDSLESGMYFAPEVVPDVLAKCGFTLPKDILFRLPFFQHKVLSLRNPDWDLFRKIFKVLMVMMVYSKFCRFRIFN